MHQDSDTCVPLCLCGDGRYAGHLPALFWSLAQHHRPGQLQLHFLNTDPEGQPYADRVKTMAARFGLECATYEGQALLAECIPEFPRHPWTPYLNRSIYAKCLWGRVLPAAMDRIVYMDLDMLCAGSLRELPGQLPSGSAVAAAVDLVAAHCHEDRFQEVFAPHLRSLGLPVRRTDYRNSGLLVISLEQWRRQQVLERMVATQNQFTAQGQSLWLADQDMLNVVLAGQIAPLDAQWNCLVHEWIGETYDWSQVLTRAKLLHFCGPKPWDNDNWLDLPQAAAVRYLEAQCAVAETGASRQTWERNWALFQRWSTGQGGRLNYAVRQWGRASVRQPTAPASQPMGDAQAFGAKVLATLQPATSDGHGGETAPLRTCCLVTNYNYEAYLAEAIESALNQTVPFDEIVVVDDGSTDGSRQLLQQRFAHHPRVRLVFKPNGGQLSAFHAGLAASQADVVLFLDSDDRYAPGRLEETLAAWAAHPDCAAVFCPVQFFGRQEGVGYFEGFGQRHKLGLSAAQIAAQFDGPGGDKRLEPARAEFLLTRKWHGSPTSALAVKRSVLDLFLPLPELEPIWRLRADDCIVHGLALVNQPRWYMHRPVVHYRVHGQNGYHDRKQDRRTKRRHHAAVDRLIQQVCRRLGCDPGAELQSLVDAAALATFNKHQPRRGAALRKAWRIPRRARAPWRVRWRCRAMLLRLALAAPR